MSHLASFPFAVSAQVSPATASAPFAQADLAGAALHAPVRVVALLLDDETSTWIRAVGICEGESLTPLRRAIFGGPIHVRTGSGGEFALHRGLARAILVAAPGKPEALEEDAETAA